MKVHHRTQQVGELKIFYREAGSPDAPVVLLLHGFPTSSHMFRELIPQLAESYRIIAPDLPGFGFSDAPEHTAFAYTFENVAKVMGDFVEQLGLKKFAVYVFDYGAPTGFRIALRFPERIAAVISQNGNAYVEGLSKDWAPVQAYWENPTRENREALRMLQTLETTRWQYHHGVTDPEERIAPEAILLDQTLLDRPQSGEIQLDLIGDYKATSRFIPSSRNSSARISRPRSPSGARTIRSFSRPVRRRTSATSPTPGLSSTIPGISRWKPTRRKSGRRS